MTRDDVIENLLDNPDYKENLEEILVVFFKDHPLSLSEWIDWFSNLD